MKKLLAIILTIAMLASMCVTGAFAANRVVTQDVTSVTNHYWHFQDGHSWHPVKFDNPSNTVEMDVRFDDSTSSLGCYGLSNAPSFTMTSVGVTAASVSYNFEAETWYHVKWVSDGSETVIYVNGEEVGTASAGMTYYEGNQFYWAPVHLSMDNVSVGGQVFDFEGDDNSRWNTESTQGERITEDLTIYGDIHNELQATGENHYWHFQDGHSWHPVKFDNPSNTVEMDVRFDDSTSSLGCYGLSNAPSFTMTSVGVTAASVPYNFEAETWYHVKWVSDGSETAIYVNGEEVGTASAGMTYYEDNQFYWAPVHLSMDNVSVGGQVFDFEGDDNSRWNTESTQGERLVEEVTTYTGDLGAYYWHFQDGHSWHPVKFDNPSNTVEMDVRFDDSTSSLGCYGLSNAPSFTMTSVGVTAASVSYNFEAETWYHVKWVSDGSATDIYVDGVKVGTASAGMTYYEDNQFYWAPVHLSMDNVSVGGQTFDFEGDDNSRWNTESTQGERLAYDLTVKGDTIFDHIETYDVGGQAWLLAADSTAEATYYYITGVNPNGIDYILNFDLALVPNPSERVKNESSNRINETYFELWTKNYFEDGRYKIGEIVGKGNDLMLYNWGDMTPDNFHNITYVIKGSYGTAQLYVDKELVNETTVSVDGLWDSCIIGQIYNGSAIFDNVQLFSLDYSAKSVNMTDVHDMDERWFSIDLDASCSGRTTGKWNGHIPGNSVITTAETCTQASVDTIYCAVCGAACCEYNAPALGHKWTDITNGHTITSPTAVKDGVRGWSCRRCDVALTSSLPAYNKYVGDIWTYMDFETPDLVTKVLGGFKESSDQTVHNGYGEVLTGSSDNYNHIYNVLGTCPWNYSVTFDFKDVSTFNTNDTTQYGHTFYFWFGGDSGIAGMAGYDFDNECFYIKPDRSNGGGFDEVIYAEAPINDGEWHTFTFIYNVTDEDTAYIGILLDGEEKAAITDPWDASQVGASTLNANKDWIIFRNFGVACKMDNLVFGSSDFRWVEEPAYGDVNGDGKVSAIDLLCLKLYIADVYTDADIVVANADVNGDGSITVDDYIGTKNIILGVN